VPIFTRRTTNSGIFNAKTNSMNTTNPNAAKKGASNRTRKITKAAPATAVAEPESATITTGGLTITVSGEMFAQVKWIAKQACVTIDEFLSIIAHDEENNLMEYSEGSSGRLDDFINRVVDYGEAADFERATSNLKALNRKKDKQRIAEILPTLKELHHESPGGTGDDWRILQDYDGKLWLHECRGRFYENLRVTWPGEVRERIIGTFPAALAAALASEAAT
jgi:hypothetical protein